jgi:hypothetical protein
MAEGLFYTFVTVSVIMLACAHVTLEMLAARAGCVQKSFVDYSILSSFVTKSFCDLFCFVEFTVIHVSTIPVFILMYLRAEGLINIMALCSYWCHQEKY